RAFCPVKRPKGRKPRPWPWRNEDKAPWASSEARKNREPRACPWESITYYTIINQPVSAASRGVCSILTLSLVHSLP
ncbi:MAG: hypothetical protein Q8O30_03970, partial [Candidatus Omnitrophota bacterium]|nr:hypothetical protein [Candidatus Omnitrophota bacterium]